MRGLPSQGRAATQAARLIAFPLRGARVLGYDGNLRKLFFISLLAFGLAAQEAPPPPASPPPGLRTDAPHRGTNYDPPPLPDPKASEQAEQPAPPPPEKPLFEIPEVDWGARETWVKLALLAGSILMAFRAFRDMTD